MQLWYNSPATYWEEALPLGNGRLGAMVWSGIEQEKLSLNEDTLWSGYPRDHNVPDAAQHYPEAKRLAMEGHYHEAQEFIEKHLLGPFTQSYLPMGELILRMQHPEGAVSSYRRALDLESAVSSLQYTIDGTTYTRETFISAPDQILVMDMTAQGTAGISFTAEFTCQLRSTVTVQENRLLLEGLAPSQVDPSYLDSQNPVIYEDDPSKKGMQFMAVVSLELDGGTLVAEKDRLKVQNAKRVILRLAAQTSFNGPFRQPFIDGKDYVKICLQDLEKAEKQAYDAIKSRHIQDYQNYFQRVTLSLGPGQEERPIPERLNDWDKEGDPGLFALLFQYGRYLLISASRPGTQATNLQGIWNQHLRAPWSSNYTININTEMNYWPAEVVGLPELHQPLFDLLNTLRITGAKTAKVHYGASGMVSHHNTDIWGLANPVGNRGKGTAGYAFWPLSAGWLSSHAYEHYLFSGDTDFLRQTAYPIIRDAARFYLDILAEDQDGSLIFVPSTSPENRFLYQGKPCSVAKTSTMTTAIIRETLSHAIDCCKILDIDPDFQAQAEAVFKRLPSYQIGSRGELLEWSEELTEAEPEHRHTSHLYPLYPGHEISPRKTPNLASACCKTLELRGDESTGWALAWRINLWARLGNSDKAYTVLKKQLRPVSSGPVNYMGGGGCYPNLFGAHPPFQIDSNYGVCAGIAELLLQSEEHVLLLLPALPKAFSNGFVTGLRARGGVTVDIRFQDGLLQEAVLTGTMSDSKDFTVCWAGKEKTITLSKGQSITLTKADF